MSTKVLALGLAVAAPVFALVGCTASAEVSPPPPAPSSGCSQDPNVAGCQGNATGYSCAAGDTPENSDLVCSDPTPSGDLDTFCCVQFTSSTCMADPNVGGCSGNSIGFSCTGTDTPDEADSHLNCSTTPTPGNNGELLYCCVP